MATEFNYVANIDTTRIMGAVAEIRSQIGMALGSATGFAGRAVGIAGGGFAGDPSATAANMLPGFGRFTPNMFGGTFTNAAISYTPHYGAMVATTSFGQEQRVFQGGLGAAAKMAPPGVSPAEYFIGSETNRINRDIEARHQAQFAARSTFYSGMGGLAAGEVASAVAFPIGAMAGGKLASRFLGGKSAIGAGKFLGGLGLGLLAYDWAMDEVGGRIQEHFANVERIGGMTRELGELAGAGRGLKRTSRYELGIAARKAAGDIKMDVQEMGDVLALGRNFGMLPNSTDPSKAREQFREFARAIDEGAQILHTSLAGAAQTIKTATSHGMTAQEGVIRAAAMGGSAAFN
ncbi:MAG: hypothetical protein ACE5D3_06295, partial [Candidatus Binatia bacterium]